MLTTYTMKELWRPTRFSPPWRVSAGAIKLAVALLTKVVLRTVHRVQTKNTQGLMKAIHNRPSGQSLITVCNHASCLDDPVIWSFLPFSTYLSAKKMRWTPAASELVFTSPLYSWFFSRVGLTPITRGLGVYQQGLNYCQKLVNDGKWVHMFPEGKINITLNHLRLKWGVGRLIAEANVVPTVIPIWHIGMDDILPNRSPYIPRLFKKLTIVVGDPIDVSPILNAHKDIKGNAVLLRKQVTDMVQQKLYELKEQAETLHNDWTVRLPTAHRSL